MNQLSLKEQFERLEDRLSCWSETLVEPKAFLQFRAGGIRSEPPYSGLEAMDWRSESAFLTVYTGKSLAGTVMELAGFRREDIEANADTCDADFDLSIDVDLSISNDVQRLQDALNACERLGIAVECFTPIDLEPEA